MDRSRNCEPARALFAAMVLLGTSAWSQTPLGKFEREIGGLRGPTAAVFLDEQTVLIVESDANCITRLRLEAGDGARSRIGRRGSGDGELLSPQAIAIGLEGGSEAGETPPAEAPAPKRLLYVSDAGNHRVVVFTLDGEFKQAFGRRGAGPGEFVRPAGIAVHGERVYVADEGAGRVQVFSTAGKFERSIGRFGTDDGALIRPVDVGVADVRVLVVDADSSRVKRFNPDGTFEGQWGDWGSARGLLSEPTGILIRPDGVYVTEWVNCRVSVFSAEGKFHQTWGAHALRPREGGGKLHYPMRTALAPSGNRAVICEPMEDRCQVFTRYAAGETIERVIPPSPDEISSHFGPRGATAADVAVLIDQEGRGIAVYDVTGGGGIDIHRFGTVGDEPGNFRRPTAVAIDATGRKIAVADAGARRLSFFELERPAGPIRQLPNLSRFVRSVAYDALDRRIRPRTEGSPLDIADVAILPGGELACIDGHNGRVVVFDADLGFVKTIGEYGDRDGAFLAPETLAVTPDGGGVWVVDSRRRCVQLFDVKRGAFQRSIGGEAAGLSEPFGVAVGADGGLFVSDVGAATISRFDAAGALVKRWGAVGLGAGEFSRPRDVMIDARGRLLVVDHGNHRVQIFAADGGFVSAFGARLFVVPTLKRPVRP